MDAGDVPAAPGEHARQARGSLVELGAFASALVRRWYLVVVATALAAGACAYTWSAVGATHESRASVLLFPPERDAVSQDAAPGNPYLELVGLNSARDILIRTLTSQSERDAVGNAYPGADYGLVADATSSGPIIVVEVSARTGQEALAAQSMLLEDIPLALEDLQDGLGLAPQELITVREITVDDRAEAVHKSQLRAAIVASAFVVVIALVLIALVDGLLAGRSQSRRRTNEDEPDPDRTDEGVSPEDQDADPEAEPDAEPDAVSQTAPDAVSETTPEVATKTDPVLLTDEHLRRLNPKQARKLARRAARDDALRVAREESRELDRAGA